MKIMVVTHSFQQEEGMQESDLLDQLPDGEAREDSGTDHVMLVSLGCFCGPKLSFKHIGRGSETLPFDWMRTDHHGLMHFLKNDFEGFYEFVTKKPVPDGKMTIYRGFHHSFWHDDPTDPNMRVRYERRITRFNNIDARSKPVLFVRCVPSTDELMDVPELLNVLRARHGKQACLLLIIDFQMTAKGAAIVEGHENLLVYYLSGDVHIAADGNPTAPYCAPVLCALDWIVGRSIPAMKFRNMEEIIHCADETHWGNVGMGGMYTFEAVIDNDEKVLSAATERTPVCPPLLRSDALECQVLAKAAPDNGITFVSLGCATATKRTLQHMGRGTEALPFDWVRVTHEGLVHFLKNGFEAPIREGLGADGQRPSEEHGFFDVMTRKKIPGSTLTMCRTHMHSFWHDDVAEPDTRAMLDLRINRFNKLGDSGRTLLFIRTVTTTAELTKAAELFSALESKFGEQVCLLLIADFQHTCPGPYVIEGFNDILVYFLDCSAHENRNAAPYRKPIECAIEWLQGTPFEAQCVPDFHTLHDLADETCWGLIGVAGLNAFEHDPKKPQSASVQRVANGTAVDDAWLN